MAQEIVSSLLLKLADAVIQEAIILYGVTDKVESVQRDLRWIQSFLKDADSKRKGDNGVQLWVKEVREVSFLIEDTLDSFLFEVESLSLKKAGVCNTIKRVCKKPMKLVAMHNLDSEINKIQARLKEIKENKDRYDIKDLGDGQIMKVPNRPPVIPEIDEIDLVGFNTEKNKVIELLLDENISRRSVVSIVGQGGLGKTTLAEKVFQSDEIKQHFDVQVWLTVSQDFKPIELLKKIHEKAAGTKIEKEYDEEYYTKVNKSLKEKRYFIVLDDIWKDDVWPQIKIALPDRNNASRVLITTRFLKIAKAADPQSDPYELPFLNEDESLKLIFKKALPGENFDNKGYPHDLIEIARSFSKQCGGLPLALVVVGGLLSTKDRTGSAWGTVLSSMDWQTDGNKCTEILASSYEDMPVHLKTCFIYLASFPDDTAYHAFLVIRLWVAEGFIPYDGRGTMEERAEKYLEELAQRCMIQVTGRYDDSIWYFRVHDLLLDLAIREAEEKDFLNVFPKQNNSRRSSVARRASFQLNDYSWDATNQLMVSISNVRTLFFFGKVVPFDSQFKLLRVLKIIKYRCPDGKDDPCWLNNIKKLLHLRCLVFLLCEFRKFVFAIDNLHNLQTLVISDCEGIIASNIVLKDSEPILGIKSLKDVCCNIGIVIQIAPNTPNLQITDGDLELPGTDNPHLILTIKTDSWEQSFTRLSKLKKSYPYIIINSLQLNAAVIPTLEIIQTLGNSWNYLSSLYLNGEIQPKNALLNNNRYLYHIALLTLSHSYIEHDPMLVSKSCPNLEKLVLYKCAYVGKQMICSSREDGIIPSLNYLEISLLEELEEWHIEDEAIPHLKHLIIHKCRKLRMLPELQYCRELETLELKGMPKKFIRRVQNEDQYKTKHIPKIIINNHSFENRIREESESELESVLGDSNF